ncbi:hypothetical protein LOAG_01976 [Loa loa]|uniref:Uncharacterized protein n=1 Tax=Loa loa TaxID=7209 RepID=A0A1S0U7L5_LOALO|nr:hypothetical protein LOAG_01976 [Loa loa]EFO26506.1 hypothetical protein LOAG_01976 [Loa loa]
MSNNQHKNFSPEAVSLLAHMMNMTLNKAEQLSQYNQLPIEKPKIYESSEMKDINKAPSENASSSVPRINSLVCGTQVNTIDFASYLNGDLDFVLTLPIFGPKVSEHQREPPAAELGVDGDVLSASIMTGPKNRKIQIPKECPSATFNYMMKARKDNKDIFIPAKIVVTQLRKAGIDISFYLETQLHPELPPLYLRIFCPNYEPKQVWINGKECIH